MITDYEIISVEGGETSLERRVRAKETVMLAGGSDIGKGQPKHTQADEMPRTFKGV